MRMRFAFLVLVLGALLAVSPPARAADTPVPLEVKSDTAYIVFRTVITNMWDYSPVLVRELGDDELTAAIELIKKDGRKAIRTLDTNIARSMSEDPYAANGDEKLFVLAVKPGVYVLAGEGSPFESAAAFLCLCLGTVKFEAKAGTLTDIGTVFAQRDDKPTAVPELVNHIRGTDEDIEPVPIAVALRPFAPGMLLPDALAKLPHATADFHAAGPFPNYLGANIDRLPAIAGVLDYDVDGHVIDVKAAAR